MGQDCGAVGTIAGANISHRIGGCEKRERNTLISDSALRAKHGHGVGGFSDLGNRGTIIDD